MARVQTALIWVAYAVAIVVLAGVASIFVFSYQKPGERSVIVSFVSIITLTSLLATVLLLPVDIALVSSTSLSSQGRKKDWATPSHVHSLIHTLQIVYYTLYSWDALLCLLVIPFTYFFYEEQQDDGEDGNRSLPSRIWGAVKYTIAFFLLAVILFLVGFFVPVSAIKKGRHLDLDYFRSLLSENGGERALTFAIGLLATIGTVLFVLYTGPGFALFPISLIKSAPRLSAPALADNTSAALEANRERQRQLEARSLGQESMPTKDRREMDALLREERTLVRRERLVAEARGEGQSWLMRAWHKTEAVFRPVKLLGGIFLLLVAFFIAVAMLITGIDKAKNSVCKSKCGYIIAHVKIFNPINWLLVISSKVFPLDYVLFALLVLFFFCSSVVGVAGVGIRFLWLRLFEIRRGATAPQALLMAIVMLTLISLAVNFALTTIVAPQYATFGPQTFCANAPLHPGAQPDCRNHTELIRPCSERATAPTASGICTPSVMSTFVNRVNIRYPYFGAFNFWAQFAFLVLFFLVFVTALIRTPKLDQTRLDQDAEEAEEEGLLASTGRRFGATWQDITGRANNQG